MDVRYPPDSEPGERKPELVEQATATLAKLRTVRSVTFPATEWHRSVNAKGQTVHRLSLRDHEGEVSTEFTLAELANPNYVILSTAHLYGDLLRIHSNHARERFLEILAMPEEAF